MRDLFRAHRQRDLAAPAQAVASVARLHRAGPAPAQRHVRHAATPCRDLGLELVDRADEARHEAAVRDIRRSRSGVPTCRITPLSITAMRSDSVIASSWSWVTTTKVTPVLVLDVHQLELGVFAQFLVERAPAVRPAAAAWAAWPAHGPAPRAGAGRRRSGAACGRQSCDSCTRSSISLHPVLALGRRSWSSCFRP